MPELGKEAQPMFDVVSGEVSLPMSRSVRDPVLALAAALVPGALAIAIR